MHWFNWLSINIQYNCKELFFINLIKLNLNGWIISCGVKIKNYIFVLLLTFFILNIYIKYKT